MNLRRGLWRLWIIASCIWVIGWLAYVWSTCTMLPGAGGPFMICHTSPFWPGFTEMGMLTVRDYLDLAIGALVGPAALLVVGLATGWVAAGFRSAKS